MASIAEQSQYDGRFIFRWFRVDFPTLKWVDWFNKQRLLGLLEPIGNIPPIEDEEKYYAALDINKLAA